MIFLGTTDWKPPFAETMDWFKGKSTGTPGFFQPSQWKLPFSNLAAPRKLRVLDLSSNKFSWRPTFFRKQMSHLERIHLEEFKHLGSKIFVWG